MSSAFRFLGRGEPAKAGGGAPPSLPQTMSEADSLPARLDALHRQVGFIRELLAEGSTVTAHSELGSVEAELGRLTRPVAAPPPPPAVGETMARLRVLVAEMPEWKRLGVRVWLGGVRGVDLYALDLQQSRMLVLDLGRILNLLEKGGRQ